MLNTVQAVNHRLWDQIVKKELDAKKRFEYLTGETNAKQFYSNQNKDNVEKNMTINANASILTQGGFASSKINPVSRSVQGSPAASSKHNRYNSTSRADKQSATLDDGRSDQYRSTKRGSSTVSRSVAPHPFVNSSKNAVTFRDIDS